MEEIVAAIKDLYHQTTGTEVLRLEKLPQSGSDRVYFRIHAKDSTCIATYNLNKKENQTFIYFSNHFKDKHLPVPSIIAYNSEVDIYLQEDLGTASLLNQLEENGPSEAVYQLYCQTLSQLAKVQILGDEGLDYENCLTAKSFGRQAIVSDLLYFKYYFLDTLKKPYDKQALLNDFETLASYLDNAEHKYFLYRDFQSRNVVVNNGNVYFIDYQGGMKGALQYDVASLLWQAKADLSMEWKESLLHYYIGETEKLLGEKVEKQEFISRYNGYVLIRLLQVLGAYGFRGLFERKAHFLSSIPLALKNLRYFIDYMQVNADMPVLNELLNWITSGEVMQRFETVRATGDTPLVVKICSFSYKQGCPADDTENGGGFVFDMRGILNPGRFKEYKHLTGRDKEVKDFLEQRTKMNDFLNSAYNLVDIAVEDYIKRDFASLMVSFGCTGGQHRSVYAADAMARHLKNRFGVKVQLCHIVQDAKNWCNAPDPITLASNQEKDITV